MGFELTGLEERELLALTGAYLLVSFVLAALLVRRCRRDGSCQREEL